MIKSKYIYFIFTLIIISCSEKKEYEMTSINLTEEKIEICFNQDMTDLNLEMEFSLKDGSQITPSHNIFFTRMKFDENASCEKRDKTFWEDRYLTEEDKKYWKQISNSDIVSIKWKLEYYQFDTIASGTFHIAN